MTTLPTMPDNKAKDLTIREHFAAMAMHAYISANGDNFEEIDNESIAKFSVAMADVLIAELNKK